MIGLYGLEPKSPLPVSLYPVEYGTTVADRIALARMIRRLQAEDLGGLRIGILADDLQRVDPPAIERACEMLRKVG